MGKFLNLDGHNGKIQTGSTDPGTQDTSFIILLLRYNETYVCSWVYVYDRWMDFNATLHSCSGCLAQKHGQVRLKGKIA